MRLLIVQFYTNSLKNSILYVCSKGASLLCFSRLRKNVKNNYFKRKSFIITSCNQFVNVMALFCVSNLQFIYWEMRIKSKNIFHFEQNNIYYKIIQFKKSSSRVCLQMMAHTSPWYNHGLSGVVKKSSTPSLPKLVRDGRLVSWSIKQACLSTFLFRLNNAKQIILFCKKKKINIRLNQEEYLSCRTHVTIITSKTTQIGTNSIEHFVNFTLKILGFSVCFRCKDCHILRLMQSRDNYFRDIFDHFRIDRALFIEAKCQNQRRVKIDSQARFGTFFLFQEVFFVKEFL